MKEYEEIKGLCSMINYSHFCLAVNKMNPLLLFEQSMGAAFYHEQNLKFITFFVTCTMYVQVHPPVYQSYLSVIIFSHCYFTLQ